MPISEVREFAKLIEKLPTTELLRLSKEVEEGIKNDRSLYLEWVKSQSHNSKLAMNLLSSIQEKTRLAVAIFDALNAHAIRKNPSGRINYGKKPHGPAIAGLQARRRRATAAMTRKQKQVASKKIALLVREGYPQKQAIAVGLKYGKKKR